jgi:hypothetical protein
VIPAAFALRLPFLTENPVFPLPGLPEVFRVLLDYL